MTDILRLLVVDDASNHTESLSSMLRNAGHAVRSEKVEDEEDFLEAISNSNWDLIATTPDHKEFNPFDTLNILQKQEHEIPLIIMSEDEESEQVGKLLDAGVKDVICLKRPQHAVHTILREVDVSRMRDEMQAFSSMLEEANTRAQSLVNSSHDAITYVHEGMHIYANQAYLDMFGYKSIDEIEGMPIMNMVQKKDQPGLKKFLRGYSKSKITSATHDVSGMRTDGSSFEITMEFSPASYEQERCTQIIIQVQANNEELERKLDDMSKIDQLTGAYNRRYLFDTLQKMCGVKGHYGIFFCITPDNLQQIRETQGIASSDKVLVQLAKFLKKVINSDSDFLARFEGGKFGLILNGIELVEAEELAKSLLAKAEELIIDLGKESTSTTLSIGGAIFSEAQADHHAVITRAERANGEIAEGDGNNYSIYIPSEDEMQVQERTKILAHEIKDAIKTNKLQLFYQPIISLKDDPHETYQVLLRMPRESGDYMSTVDFFETAKSSGLAIAVDRWVIAYSMKALSEKRKSGSLTKFFVKLTDSTIQEPAKFLPWLLDVAKAARLEPNVLTLSVSEDIARSNLKSLKLLVKGLKKLRINLALDHFGKEVNFQNVIKHVDPTYLILDQSIVNELSSSQQALDKVRDITVAASEERRQVIADGVANPHTLATIYSTGIDYIQGYFLGEPSEKMDYDFNS
jgi:diguanylate cyclase (GGDEF)-like protein/PAS domain S-box-containing protein